MSKIVVTREDSQRNRFEQAVEAQHTCAARTAEELRKVILLDGKNGQKRTEISDFSKGQVDPQLQLVLIARDEFLAAEDPNVKLGFFRAMRDGFIKVDEKTMQVLDVAMKERHHREKLELLAQKSGLTEPTDAEIDKAIEGDV